MLGLVAVNAGGTAAYALLYAAAGARWLTQPAFLAGLVVSFVAVTALWVRIERAGRRDGVARVGRAAVAFAVTVIAAPGLTLMPLFALKDVLPPGAPIDDLIRPAMVLLLVSLVLTTLTNAAGAAVALGAALKARVTAHRSHQRN